MAYKPVEVKGLTGKFIQADIDEFKLEEFYQISHGYCNGCYPIVRQRMHEELGRVRNKYKLR